MKVVTRAQWGATAPLGPPMTLPVKELWLHHSVTQLTDDPYADMKVIERVGVQRFGRFSYSWAYHARKRLLLEGAGDTIGAHTKGRNSTSLGLVLIGNYQELDLTDDGVADLQWAIEWLISGNRLKPDVYPTGGHRDLKATACPGINAYTRIPDIRQKPAPTPPEDDDMKPPQIYNLAGAAGTHAYLVQDNGIEAHHLDQAEVDRWVSWGAVDKRNAGSIPSAMFHCLDGPLKTP